MGVRVMQVWDDDEVDVLNIPTQLHKVSDVGYLKACALGRTLEQFSDELTFLPAPERVRGTTVLRSRLIISAVDSITARQEIWDALFNEQSNWEWFLDCRMGALEYQHFLVPNEELQQTRYWSMLSQLTEENVPDVPCTEKATFFTAMTAAGHAGKVLYDIVRGEAHPHRLVHNIPNNWLQTFGL
jgi:hypothetical protein